MAEKRIKNELDDDYILVGIASSLKEYRLCHFMNLLLGCDFKKLEDLVFESRDRGQNVQFSVFKAGEEDIDRNQFVVFTNKYLGQHLLNEVSNFDYILQIWGKYSDEELHVLMDGIKLFPQTVMTAEVPLKKVKTRERLVYHEEKPAAKLLTTKRLQLNRQ
jgi:hypothetical protein